MSASAGDLSIVAARTSSASLLRRLGPLPVKMRSFFLGLDRLHAGTQRVGRIIRRLRADAKQVAQLVHDRRLADELKRDGDDLRNVLALEAVEASLDRDAVASGLDALDGYAFSSERMWPSSVFPCAARVVGEEQHAVRLLAHRGVAEPRRRGGSGRRRDY